MVRVTATSAAAAACTGPRRNERSKLMSAARARYSREHCAGSAAAGTGPARLNPQRGVTTGATAASPNPTEHHGQPA